MRIFLKETVHVKNVVCKPFNIGSPDPLARERLVNVGEEKYLRSFCNEPPYVTGDEKLTIMIDFGKIILGIMASYFRVVGRILNLLKQLLARVES
jgi:hypothetical protein